MISPLGDLILDAGGDDFFRNHSDSFEHFQGVLVVFLVSRPLGTFVATTTLWLFQLLQSFSQES